MEKYASVMDLDLAKITVELERKLELNEIWDMEDEPWFQNGKFLEAIIALLEDKPNVAKRWISSMSKISSEFTGSFVEDTNPEIWGDLGVDIDEILNLYFQRDGGSHLAMQYVNDALYLGRPLDDDFPEWLTLNYFLKFVPMKYVISECRYGFDYFIECYLKAGGDFCKLAEKFINEVGYSNNYEDFDAMACMLCTDSSMFDLVAFANGVDCDQLSDKYEREWYYCVLQGAGLDSTHLKKFA